MSFLTIRQAPHDRRQRHARAQTILLRGCPSDRDPFTFVELLFYGLPQGLVGAAYPRYRGTPPAATNSDKLSVGLNTLAVEVWKHTSEAMWQEAAVPALAIVAAGILPVLFVVRLSAKS